MNLFVGKHSPEGSQLQEPSRAILAKAQGGCSGAWPGDAVGAAQEPLFLSFSAMYTLCDLGGVI